MSGFLALVWRASDPSSRDAARGLAALMDADPGWAAAGRSPRAAVWTRAGRRLPVLPAPADRGFLIGDLHPPVGETRVPGAHVAAILADVPAAASRRLTASAWGAYIALFTPADDEAWAYRDPSGALEAFHWTRKGVQVLASGLEDLPPGLWPDRSGLDWDSIGRILRAPGRSARETPLEGVGILAAGVLQPLGRSGGGTTIWSPAAFAALPARDALEAQRALVRRVDGVVAAQAARHERLLVEVSGGLDSAIIGSALAAAGLDGRVAAWVNYHGARREGDERAYARAVAHRLGARLTEVPLTVEPVGEADFADLARGARPPMTALGVRYDRDMAGRAATTGASAIVSGQGGDAVFFQMPTPLLVADALRLQGLSALRSGILGDVARWTRRPAGSVLAAALRAQGALTAPVAPAALPGLRADAPRGLHPWVVAAAGAPPAKQLQIAAIAGGQVYAGDSRRRRAAEVLRPLLAQPIVELMLAIPTPMLAAGGRDRALARRAFAERLPATVIARRSKGGLGAYYGQVVLESLDWLRPHLLDGCLCDAGLIDRDQLAQALTPEQLVWRGIGTEVLAAAVTETWVRYWQGRVPDSAAAPRTRIRGQVLDA